jgi:hypothetical protein
MGAEFRGKGINVALGPAMNFMRAPAGTTQSYIHSTVANQ